MPGFWDQKCPTRSQNGLRLVHMHAGACRDADQEHFDDQCCFCGARRSDYTADGTRITLSDPMPGQDVAARLRQLGMLPASVIPEDITPLLPPEMREPKLATGKLEGPVWERGRGDLSPRDKIRLGFVKWQAEQHPDDH